MTPRRDYSGERDATCWHARGEGVRWYVLANRWWRVAAALSATDTEKASE